MKTAGVGKRIKEKREAMGMSQADLAAKVPCSRATICRIELEDRNVTMKMLYKIARALDAEPSYFIGNAKSPPLLSNDAVLQRLDDIDKKLNFIPVDIIGTVSAGHLETKDQQHLGKAYLFVEEGSNVKKNLFALKIDGDSLNGDGLFSGDIAFFDRHGVFEDGKIFVVRISGRDTVIRHVFKSNGIINLLSSNQEFKPVKAKEVEILGKLIHSQRNF